MGQKKILVDAGTSLGGESLEKKSDAIVNIGTLSGNCSWIARIIARTNYT